MLRELTFTPATQEHSAEFAAIFAEKRSAAFEPNSSPKQCNPQLDQRVADTDPRAALAAAAAQQEPAQDRNILPTGEDVVAAAAVGAGRDDALFLRKTLKDDVEEAAEGEAEQRGEDCAEDLEFLDDCGFAPSAMR